MSVAGHPNGRWWAAGLISLIFMSPLWLPALLFALWLNAHAVERETVAEQACVTVPYSVGTRADCNRVPAP